MITYRAPVYRNKANENLTHEQRWKEDFIRELQNILMPQMKKMADAQFDKCGKEFPAKELAAIMARELWYEEEYPDPDYS